VNTLLKNIFFSSPSALLPVFYSLLAVFFAASYFTYLGHEGREHTISLFGIGSTIIFLATHLSSFGVDHSIVGDKSNMPKSIIKLDNDKVSVDFRIFFPFISPLISTLIVVTLSMVSFNDLIDEMFTYSNNNLLIYIIFTLTIFSSITTKILTSFLLIAGLTNLANLFYLGKSLGLMIGILIFELYYNYSILIIFFVMELTSLLLIAGIYIYMLLKSRIAWNKASYQYKYILSSFNVFGLDAILKIDLLILSFFGTSFEVARYAVLSNVFEGLSQLIISMQIKYASLLRSVIYAHKVNISTKLEFQNLLTLARLISFLFFIAAFLFYTLVFKLPDLAITVLIIIFQFTLIVAAAPIVTYFTYSILRKPLTLLLITLIGLVGNVVASIMLYNQIGIYGVITASLLTFLLFRLTIQKKAFQIFTLDEKI